MQAIWQPWTVNTRCSFCCSTCLRAIAPFSRESLMIKESYRKVRARSRAEAVSAYQHARSKSAGSPEAMQEQDMPQTGSRPLRIWKPVDQGQAPHAQPQQRRSPQSESEAHTSSGHQPASSRHAMAGARWRPPTQKRGVIAGTRPARKASVPHSTRDISRRRGPGHAKLQHYWSALEEGMLQGESHVTTFEAPQALQVRSTDPASHALLQLLQACVVAKDASSSQVKGWTTQVEEQMASWSRGGPGRSSALCARPVRKLWQMGSWQKLCACCSARSLASRWWTKSWRGI